MRGKDVVEITLRNRNLAFTWTNEATQTYEPGHGGMFGHLRVKPAPPPRKHDSVGLAGIEREVARAAKINSGGVHWNHALWVGRRRVMSILMDWGWEPFVMGSDLILALRRDGKVTVELGEKEE